MRITYKGDYALKSILDLAMHYNQGIITIHELAQRADMPVKFLEQVLLDLKKGGFVKSRRGINGGYFLSRHPEDIKLGEVIRFAEGPIGPIACLDEGYSGCASIYSCVFRKVYKEVAEATSGIIDNITFQDLVDRTKGAKRELVYSI